MNAKTLWQYFYSKQPKEYTTPRNKLFTLEMESIESMRFHSPTDQTRSVKFPQFEMWFDLWFIKGYQKGKCFTNKPGSKAARWAKVKVLFNSLDLESVLKYMVGDNEIEAPELPPDHADLPDIVTQEVVRFKRDSKISSRLKNLYSHKCQLCGFSFTLPSGKMYAEAHHIKPLGGGHKGKDSIENLIIVCPNHHAMLDYGAMLLNPDAINIKFPHKLNEKSIQYHNEQICTRKNCYPSVQWTAGD